MEKVTAESKPYPAPEVLPLGQAVDVTRGNGDFNPDSLGTLGTHYGSAIYQMGAKGRKA